MQAFADASEYVPREVVGVAYAPFAQVERPKDALLVGKAPLCLNCELKDEQQHEELAGISAFSTCRIGLIRAARKKLWTSG